MSLRGQFDEICDSVVNGQRRQAAEQANTLDKEELCQLIDYIVGDRQDTDLALNVAKTLIRFGGAQ